MALAGPAPREGGHRRGRRDGGPRRREGPLPQVRRRRPRGGRRPRVHRGDQDLPVVLPLQLRGAAADPPDDRPGRPHGRGAARHRPRVAAAPVRHVRPDRADRRRRRVLRHQAEVGEDDHHLPRALRRPARSGIVASQPKQLAGILENDSADKAARFVNLCDAFNIPLVFLQDVPGLHGRHRRSSRRASSATAPRCSTRSRARPCRRSRS